VPEWLNLAMLAAGVLIYGGVGVAGMMLDGLFLDYNVLLPDPSAGQHVGIILVEFGVGLTVTSVMLALFHAFAGFSENRVADNSDDTAGGGSQ
jgi:multicomponent Na+:H+ antiporter subunit B